MLGFASFEHLRLRLGRARRAYARDASGNFAMMFALAAPILNRRQRGVGKYLDHRTILSTLKRIMSPGASMAGFVRVGSKNDMSV